ncbi:MAG: (2Fe-2S)-binding protein [Acidobacteria bacterium ACB1]|nr:(2Fe-2S)-binding protein [Acidobacteria bacterium ACB1]
MPQIVANTANGTISFDAEIGRRLVLALEDNGVDILHRCGGNARCTTCRIELISILLTKAGLGPNTRLSCQIQLQNDLEVNVINQASIAGIDAGPRPEEW